MSAGEADAMPEDGSQTAVSDTSDVDSEDEAGAKDEERSSAQSSEEDSKASSSEDEGDPDAKIASLYGSGKRRDRDSWFRDVDKMHRPVTHGKSAKGDCEARDVSGGCGPRR